MVKCYYIKRVFKKLHTHIHLRLGKRKVSVSVWSLAQVIAVLVIAFFIVSSIVGRVTVIKYSRLSLKNVAPIQMPSVVGSTVRWSVIVRRSDIQASRHFIEIPKDATSITIKPITRKQADAVVALAKTKPLSQPVFLALLRGVFSRFPYTGFPEELVPMEPVSGEPVPETEIVQAPDSQFVDVFSQAPPVASSSLEPILSETPIPPPPVAEDELVQVDYQTTAPQISEISNEQGKSVTVSLPDQAAQPDLPPVVDVLAYARIPELFKVGQEKNIQIKWKNNGNQDVQFRAEDLDSNGKLDYVEWTVPHLSEQVFNIIFISKAFQLDENKTIVADIYDTVSGHDQTYATVPQGNYIRVTFNKELDTTNDITVYAKPTDLGAPSKIEVYPVYTDADGNQTEGDLLTPVSDGHNPTFDTIDQDGTYRILLANLSTPTDSFDLKVINASVDVDFIVDPVTCTASVTGNWNAAATWGGTCNGGGANGYPGALGSGDTVIINANISVTYTATLPSSFTIAQITFNDPAATGVNTTLSISTGTVLTTTGNVIFLANTGAFNQNIALNGTSIFNIGGNLNMGNAPTGAGGPRVNTVTGVCTACQLNVTGLTSLANSSAVAAGFARIAMTTGAANVFSTGSLTYTTTANGTGVAELSAVGTMTINGAVTFTGPTPAEMLLSTTGATQINLNNGTIGTNGTLTLFAGTTLTTTGTSAVNLTSANWGLITVTSGTFTMGAALTATAITVSTTATLAAGTFLLTDTGNFTCGSGGSATVSGSGGITLNATAAVISGGTCAVTNSGTFLVSGATTPTVSAGAAYTFSGILSVSTLLTNSGTVTVSVGLAGAGNFAQAASAILNIGFATAPAITTLTASNTTPDNLVKYTAAAPNCKVIAYDDLTFSGSGAITCATLATVTGDLSLSTAGTMTWTTGANLAVTGTFIIATGVTFTTGAFTFAVTGATTVNSGGSIVFSSATNPGKTFTGDVLINGVWNEQAAVTPTFGGNFTNNATTFTASSGAHTFSGATKVISGTTASVIPSVSITGATANSNTLTVATLLTVATGITLTNNGTVTATTALSGLGSFVAGASSTLNIGFAGAPAITTLTASNTTPDNLVNYTAAAPNCKVVAYDDLTFSGSGIVTCATLATVTGDLSLSTAGTMTWTMGVNLAVTGTYIIGTGVTVTGAASATLTVTGATTVNGAITFPNTAALQTFTGGLTIASGATWANAGNSTLTFGAGGLTNNTAGVLTMGTGLATFNATGSISGAQGVTFGGAVTVSAGTLTNANTGTVTIATTLTLTGAWTQGANSTLSLTQANPFSGIGAFTATASGNMVIYTGSAAVIKVASYVNLSLNGGGAVTGAVTTVTGALNVQSSSVWTQDAITSTLTAVTVGSTASLTIGANMTISGALTLVGGTFNANNLTVTAASFSSANANPRTLTMGSNTWTLTGTGTVWDTSFSTLLTVTPTASTIKITDTSNTAITFAGGGNKVLGNIWFSRGASTASNTISGSNTFTDLKDTGTAAHSLIFANGTTQTVATFTVSGTLGNVITINSDTTGTHTLSQASGTVNSNYVNIQHSIATGGAVWNAGANSINNNGVITAGSGWLFNVAPVASSVSIDSAATAVNLTEGTTKNVVCTAVVTDANGFADITSVQAKLYRTGVGAGASDANANHYTVAGDSQCIPSGGSGTTENYTCTFPVQFYADATDVGAPNAADDWTCQVTPSDAAGAGTAATDAIEMNSLTALDVTSTVAYGPIALSGNTGTTDQTTVVTDTGNRQIDIQVDGYGATPADGFSMVCAIGNVTIGNERYSLSAATAWASKTPLTATAFTETTFNLVQGATATKNVYWGFGLPSTGVGGSCTGKVNFTAVNG